MLFLFTDIDRENAPTRIRVGSHWDVPRVLGHYGDRGTPGQVLGPQVDAASARRPVTLATGRRGDVYLCHPFRAWLAWMSTVEAFRGPPAVPSKCR